MNSCPSQTSIMGRQFVVDLKPNGGEIIAEVKGTFDRETKRMVRYTTDWGTIYVNTDAIKADNNGEIPQTVMIKVTPIDEN